MFFAGIQNGPHCCIQIDPVSKLLFYLRSNGIYFRTNSIITLNTASRGRYTHYMDREMWMHEWLAHARRMVIVHPICRHTSTDTANIEHETPKRAYNRLQPNLSYIRAPQPAPALLLMCVEQKTRQLADISSYGCAYAREVHVHIYEIYILATIIWVAIRYQLT